MNNTFFYIKEFLKIIPRLGLKNVLYVILYRFAIYSGLIKRINPAGIYFQTGPIFDDNNLLNSQNNSDFFFSKDFIKEATLLCHGYTRLFSNKYHFTGSPPDWFRNPFNKKVFKNYTNHFTQLNDFNKDFGDIKTIWDLSRFNWAPLLARAYLVTDNISFLNLLIKWSSDWAINNPVNSGPNWKCGQEVSIRLIQVLLTSYLLNQLKNPKQELISFVKGHCSRIITTIPYAISQNNNHGTSEAAALYIGGAWLASVSNCKKNQDMANFYLKKGKYWLEDRVKSLILKDGSFSQYSLNYHRVLVDTLNIVEFFRIQNNGKEFSKAYYEKTMMAIKWLYEMINPQTGRGPNLGANDGSRLFNLTSLNYNDYRDSVQLAYVLFIKKKAYPVGKWDEVLYWLGVNIPKNIIRSKQRKTKIYPQGGYITINKSLENNESIWALIRFPNFDFRPSHLDALHFDLWIGDKNIFRDGGSFSYNTVEKWQTYFPGTLSHNTVQFDDHDQMPKISRFLFGIWLRMKTIRKIRCLDDIISWSGTYVDYMNCEHERSVIMDDKSIKIIDRICGFRKKAVLRWRLMKANWKISGYKCSCNYMEISIKTNRPIVNFCLNKGYESLFYMEMTEIPVLEIQVKGNHATIETYIKIRKYSKLKEI